MFNNAKRRIKVLTDEEIDEEIERRLLELGPYTEEEYNSELNERKDEDPFGLDRLVTRDLVVQELQVESSYVDNVISNSDQSQKKLDLVIQDLKSTANWATDILKKFDQAIDTSWVAAVDFEKDVFGPLMPVKAPTVIDTYSDKKAAIQKEIAEIKKMESEYLSKVPLTERHPSVLKKLEEDEKRLLAEKEKRVKERNQLVQHDLEITKPSDKNVESKIRVEPTPEVVASVQSQESTNPESAPEKLEVDSQQIVQLILPGVCCRRSSRHVCAGRSEDANIAGKRG
jgi:hypothetical protein